MSRSAVIALSFVLLTSALQAQRLERSLVGTAGGSSDVGTARISWSVGEPATGHIGVADEASITQGFQQPYYSAALIRTENFSGMPGDTGVMNILLDQFQGIYGAGISTIDLQLRFNATLLEPIVDESAVQVLADEISGGDRTLALRLPVPPVGLGPEVLATMRFAIGLGNDSITAMQLIDPRPLDAPLRFRTASGEFKLLGICYEGGPRLVDPVRRPAMKLRPNPASATATLEFDVYESGGITATVLDMFGRPVRTIADENLAPGHYSLAFDAGLIPSGSYVVVLQTPSARISRPLIIQR